MKTLKSFAFRRPYCSPPSGFVTAYTGPEALELVHYAHGYADRTRVFCALTGEEWLEESGQKPREVSKETT